MIANNSELRLGVDLGGSKIEAAILAPGGKILARRRRPTPRQDYRGTLAAIAALIEEVERMLGLGAQAGTPLPLGMAIPGACSLRDGRIKNANSTWLLGKPLLEDLAALLGRPLRLANDANCFALSEATDGAAAGYSRVFGVILGTGVGGGLVTGGRAVTGRNAIAGEWGHNPLPWPDPAKGELPGPACYCGKRGCLETFLSGPGFARDYENHGGEAAAPERIWTLAQAGQPAAEAALERHLDRLARGLATVINLVDPDCIVLGGGLSNLPHLYEALPRKLPAYVFSDSLDTPVLKPKFGDSSGVRGAAWLWPAKRAGAGEPHGT